MQDSKRRNARRQTAALIVAVVLLFPIMTAAIIAFMPSADTAIMDVAGVSSKLALGDVMMLADNGNGENDNNMEYLYEPDETADNEYEQAVHSYLSLDDSIMLSVGSVEIPSSQNEEIYVPDGDYDVGPEPYPESIENRDGKISAFAYEAGHGEQYINLDKAGQIRNVTELSNERVLEETHKKPKFTIEKNGEPQVLIMHTHTTESYEPYRRDFFDKSFLSRTTDERMNMVAVGNNIQKELEAAGIGVIHDTTLHDYPSYNGSYDRSRVTVTEILEQYPSIKVVLDVHRDAIERQDGVRISPTTEINGKNAAQVMIISGCDDGGMDMPNYMQNLRFAAMFQQQMETDYPTLTRAVLFDYRKYNQDLTAGSLLIEVGGHANSIDEALYSGELIGKSLAKTLSELGD